MVVIRRRVSDAGADWRRCSGRDACAGLCADWSQHLAKESQSMISSWKPAAVIVVVVLCLGGFALADAIAGHYTPALIAGYYTPAKAKIKQAKHCVRGRCGSYRGQSYGGRFVTGGPVRRFFYYHRPVQRFFARFCRRCC